MRSQFWKEYIELSDEARNLKEHLEEQASFAVEQIELALGALEKDTDQIQELLAQMADIPLPPNSLPIEARKETYNLIQKELILLNTFAARINALRKEIMKTGMRIRYKNKFFKKLSEIGDKVFPKRKELITKLSDMFHEDVNSFIEENFKEKISLPYFTLREQIKNLQNLSKLLSLNTRCFTVTRIKLSECWDKIKLLDKTRKKEQIDKKLASKTNYDLVKEKIEEFAKKAVSISEKEAKTIRDDLSKYMRSIDLSKDHVHRLKNDLTAAYERVFEKEKEKKKKESLIAEEALKKRSDQVELLESNLSSLLQKEISSDTLQEEHAKILGEIEELKLSKSELIPFKSKLKMLEDKLFEIKEEEKISSDPSLENLQKFLQVRQDRRLKIKIELRKLPQEPGKINS